MRAIVHETTPGAADYRKSESAAQCLREPVGDQRMQLSLDGYEYSDDHPRTSRTLRRRIEASTSCNMSSF